MYLSLSHPSSKKPLRWKIYSSGLVPKHLCLLFQNMLRNTKKSWCGRIISAIFMEKTEMKCKYMIYLYGCPHLSVHHSTAATRWPLAPVKGHIKSVQPFRPKSVQRYHFGHMTAWRSCWDHMTTADLRAPEFGHCVWLAHNATGSTMSSDSV